jgi:hypothetical protein
VAQREVPCPQTSLTIVLTLGFAGPAASLFWVLRRWGASITAAALGGAVYGFSPALVQSASATTKSSLRCCRR